MAGSDERVVTIDELRRLIKAEDIRPEKLFDDAALKPIIDAAKAQGYAEGRFAAAGAARGGDGEAGDELPDHLNPAKNPWIKAE